MVRDYVQEYYEPAAAATDVALADHAARARALAAWRARVVAAWPGVKVAGVESDGGPAVLGRGAARGGHRRPGLARADATSRCRSSTGRSARPTRSSSPTSSPSPTSGSTTRAALVGTGDFRCAKAGRYGFTARVVPDHPDLATPVELGLVTWA